MVLNILKSQNIENIVIFICDSLRWDYVPSSVTKRGVLFKTVASSLYTASSFPSIISGLYPPKTGVHTWEDKLSKKFRGLFEIEGYNSSLWCETTWTNVPPDKSDIHNILGNPRGYSLDEIESPFIYIEDDKGGHCPYGYPSGEYMGGGCSEFFKEFGKKGKSKLINQYIKGIEQSVKQFYKREKVLKERGLLENTLIIFSSDHGELLGEYGGLTHHNRPPCPELVYVPTIFIHPSLNKYYSDGSVIRHVDFYPTIASILNKKVLYEQDGVDLTRHTPSVGLNFRFGGYFRSNSKIKNLMKYEASSIWDFQGGHAFHDLNRYKAFSFFFFKIFIQKHPRFNFLRENLKNNPNSKFKDCFKAIDHLSLPHIEYLRPQLSKSTAKELINNYLKESQEYREKMKIKNTIGNLIKKGNITGILKK